MLIPRQLPSPAALVATLLLAALAAALAPARAGAAVALRASSCNASTTSSVTVARPAGLTAGDLMVMAVIHEGSDFNATTPSGWTVLPSSAYAADTDDRSLVFTKRATASEPASWTIASDDSNAMAVALDAFSGVHATTPFNGTVARSTGSATTFTLPNAAVANAGSMRWSAVGHWPAYGQTARTAEFSAGLTETCDQQGNGSFGQVVGMASAHEEVGAGTTPTRSVTMSAAPESWGAWTLVLNPAVVPSSCSGGGLDLTAPSAITFPGLQLAGVDETVPTVSTLRVDDGTGSGAGWNVSVTSTTFTSGAHTLPADAATVTGVAPTAAAGNCALPANSITYPVTVPAAASAPAAAKLYNAAAASGRGPVDLDVALALRIPARTHAGTYTSTWTFTLSAAP